MQQSPNSAFVKPRQEQQRLRTAEKVSTDKFYGSRRTLKLDGPVERKEAKLAEPNNNDSTSKLMMPNSPRPTVDATGIPRRNYAKQADSEQMSKLQKGGQRKESDHISPKPRRKLPSAPGNSGPRPRTPKNHSEVVVRSSPFQNGTERPSSSEKSKSSAEATPEKTKKPKENTFRKISDSSDKKYKIVNESTSPSRKNSDPVDTMKASPKSMMGTIKYNSLPRRRPSKTKSKFYLDIEGEETLPSKSATDLSGKNDVSDRINVFPESKSLPGENGSEKISTLFKNSKLFGTLKQSNGDASIAANGNDKPDLQQTHVALYRFIPRHKDEVMLDEGDPINVIKFAEDLWCEGTNLSSGKYGNFPSRYAADILSGSGSLAAGNPEDQQFFLRFLGSVEVADYKGDEILCYAISKIVNQRAMLSSNTPPACTLQVSSRGIRVCDFEEKQNPKSSPKLQKKSKSKDKEKEKEKEKSNETRENQKVPTHFFSIKNVTFCGNHPRDRRYFGFITKHPDEHRFACHVFMSKYSTDPVAQAVGDCFKKFYSQYLDYRAPTEDIYME